LTPPHVRVLPGGGESPLRRGVYILPSLFTTGGLLAGFYSIILTFGGQFWQAAVLILVAHVLDGLDGRVARFTRTTSRFGVEYDSLADLIAFGVAPGILVYVWALKPWGDWGWLAASLYVTCGALRLARFNVQVDSVEKRSFVGLPIPAAADVIAATVLLYYYFGGAGETHRHIILLLVIYGLAALMVSNVRYSSFKEFRFRRRQAFWILVLGIILLQLVIARPQIMLFLAATGYALSGPVRLLLVLLRRRRRHRPARAAAASGRSA
jgi:CDP-diacylglycerol--serine O-phosphatidyltransferase